MWSGRGKRNGSNSNRWYIDVNFSIFFVFYSISGFQYSLPFTLHLVKNFIRQFGNDSNMWCRLKSLVVSGKLAHK